MCALWPLRVLACVLPASILAPSVCPEFLECNTSDRCTRCVDPVPVTFLSRLWLTQWVLRSLLVVRELLP